MGETDRLPRAAALHQDALVWDSHACMPLHPDADLGALARHRAAGVDFVSINVGMDMNPLAQILTTLASFRAQIERRADLFVPVEDAGDVERAKAEGKLAVAFDLEGGLPLCERPEMVRLFYDLGVRQIHLAYNRNNSIGGGCYDHDVPLSALGRRIVGAINDAGMLMDCSHTGYRTSMDIMALSRAPVIFSHANPRALADNGRNVRDDQIDACVATGGVVCVNGVGRFLGDPEAGTAAIVRHVDYLVQRISPEHVGLGIDYEYDQGLNDMPPGLDRAHWWPPAHGYGPQGPKIRIAAPEQFPEITAGLLDLGYREADVRQILGGNMLRLATQVWRPAARLRAGTAD
jgi:membrane dipeptidase